MTTAGVIRPAVGTRRVVGLLTGLAAAMLVTGSQRPIVQAVTNPIAIENQRTGDTGWDITGAGDPTIQGFATDISINTGETVDFKIQTDSTSYRIDIYRLGYYGGARAAKGRTTRPV